MKKIKRNKHEYLFLREEIMSRIAWHHDHTQKATTVSIAVWTSCFAIIGFFYKQEIDITPMIFLGLSLLMFLHIFVLLYPLAIKIYENYFCIGNIVEYLKKFYEKPIYKNDDTFFSWEIAHGDIFNHYQNKKDIIKRINRQCDELIYLSGASFLFYILFSFIGYSLLKNSINARNIIFFVISIALLGMIIYLVIKISKISVYKCVGEISKKAEEIWKEYGEEKINS